MIRLLLLLLLAVVPLRAYRMGEDIDTKVSVSSSPYKDVLRSQAPMFGIPTQSRFPVTAVVKQDTDDDDATATATTTRQPASISLSFEYGLWALPNIPVLDSRGRTLESVVVTFVYSRSGNGAIHSVTSQANYIYYNQQQAKKKTNHRLDEEQQQQQQQSPETVSVSYQWIEEHEVQTTAGQTVMYLIVFVASILGMIASCGSSSSSSDDDGDRNGASTSEMSFFASSSSVPKWD